MLELERHSGYRQELVQVLDVLHKRVAPFTARHMSRTTLNEEERQAMFDVLHGKPSEAIRGVLDGYIERHTSTMDHGERIPAYAPIVFNVRPKQTATSVIPVAQAPLRVLATLMGFAESLDDPALDVAPVMPLVRQAVVVDPLPWEW